MKLSEFVAKLQEYPQDLILEIHCPFEGMQLNLHTSDFEKTANILLVADAYEEDYRWENPELIRARMQPKEENTPTLKRMTREEIIEELVQVEENRRFFYECVPEKLMRFGFKGYNDYTDQELLEEYTKTFEEDLKEENLQVEIIPAECKEDSVQKKG